MAFEAPLEDENGGGGPTGTPGGTGRPPPGVVAGGGTCLPEPGADGAGIPAVGGAGVCAPTWVFPRRALRSIFGFFSSAIQVSSARTR
jgi:hypothetical protein